MGSQLSSVWEQTRILHSSCATSSVPMTRIYTAGQGFIYKGGYGGLAGVNEGLGDVAEVKPAVDAQAGKHVDIIKLWMDDHLGNAKKMPYDLADAIIDAAHQDHL